MAFTITEIDDDVVVEMDTLFVVGTALAGMICWRMLRTNANLNDGPGHSVDTDGGKTNWV